MSYAPESDIRVKTCDNLNFDRASVVQFQVSRYIMRLNRTSERKVMTIWISWELLLFNFKRPDMLCAWIGHPSGKLLPFEFLESIHCSISSVSLYYSHESDIRVKSYDRWNFYRASDVQFQGSQYIMSPNRASMWKFMTIWISRELPFFNFEHYAILFVLIAHTSENLWPLAFL